jgi:hypothetical protein
MAMNERELGQLRWKLVDINNDLEGLKKQGSRIRDWQLQAIQDQVHQCILDIVDADKRNTGIKTPDDTKR